jgi:hypothetical protein
VNLKIWLTDKQWAIIVFFQGGMTPAGWIAQKALLQLRCESKSLAHRQAVGHFVFFQAVMTPGGWMTR